MIERVTRRGLVVCAVLAVAASAGAQVPGEAFRDCDVCPEMVPLPGTDVALGRFEVTLEEYRAFAEAVPGVPETGCIRANYPSHSTGGTARAWTWQHPGYPQTGEHPVACLSWNEAQVYARWLSLVTGHEYRLPTDAEWTWGRPAAPGDATSASAIRAERARSAPTPGATPASSTWSAISGSGRTIAGTGTAIEG